VGQPQTSTNARPSAVGGECSCPLRWSPRRRGIVSLEGRERRCRLGREWLDGMLLQEQVRKPDRQAVDDDHVARRDRGEAVAQGKRNSTVVKASCRSRRCCSMRGLHFVIRRCGRRDEDASWAKLARQLDRERALAPSGPLRQIRTMRRASMGLSRFDASEILRSATIASAQSRFAHRLYEHLDSVRKTSRKSPTATPRRGAVGSHSPVRNENTPVRERRKAQVVHDRDDGDPRPASSRSTANRSLGGRGRGAWPVRRAGALAAPARESPCQRDSLALPPRQRCNQSRRRCRISIRSIAERTARSSFARQAAPVACVRRRPSPTTSSADQSGGSPSDCAR